MTKPAARPKFSRENVLLPAIAQDFETGEVLMLAWMNREAWELSLKEGRAVYWSRSRERLWRKGESSGNIQIIHEIYLDCDADTILMKVEQVGGAACHTGRRSCFYTKIGASGPEIVSEPLFDPAEVYGTE